MQLALRIQSTTIMRYAAREKHKQSCQHIIVHAPNIGNCVNLLHKVLFFSPVTSRYAFHTYCQKSNRDTVPFIEQTVQIPSGPPAFVQVLYWYETGLNSGPVQEAHDEGETWEVNHDVVTGLHRVCVVYHDIVHACVSKNSLL